MSGSIRFAYATGGAARRGPVTLRARDVVRLRVELAKHPELGAALGLEAADPKLAARKLAARKLAARKWRLGRALRATSVEQCPAAVGVRS